MSHFESTQTVVNKSPDSLEIGTPGKGGAIKIYGDYSDSDAMKEKIDKAKELRDYARVTLDL